MSKNTAAFGIYQTYTDAEYAVDALRAEGFRNTDVSVLFPENKGTKDFAVEKNTKAPEGTAAGGAPGLSWAACWDGSPESAHSLFRASGR
jgi:heat induced stress protein YflT